jgi:hypothetical protein
MGKIAKYFDKYNRLLFSTDCIMLACAVNLLRMDGVRIPSDRTGIRDTIFARYGGNHTVEVVDHSKWRIRHSFGILFQDTDYDAIENELDENSGKIRKTIYYIHRYTIRYYVIFMRWYIAKATAFVSYVKEKTNEKVAHWVEMAVLYVIPYLFHIFILAVYKKVNDQPVRFFRLLIPALLLSGVSTILFYFGMSPWALFVVCVGVPLTIYMLPTIIESTAPSPSSGNSYGNIPLSTSSDGYNSSSSDDVTTTYTDVNGCEYEGKGTDPDTIEKQTPGDHAIFDKSIDGTTYKERFGDRELRKP